MFWFMVAMAVMAAVSAISAGNAEKAASETQAELLARQARRTEQVTALNAKRARKDADALSGSQIALLAGQGRDPGAGSALLLQEDLAEEGEHNARLIENQGLADVVDIRTRREVVLTEGKNAQRAGYLSALTGATMAAGKSGAGSGSGAFGGGSGSTGYTAPSSSGGWAVGGGASGVA